MAEQSEVHNASLPPEHITAIEIVLMLDKTPLSDFLQQNRLEIVPMKCSNIGNGSREDVVTELNSTVQNTTEHLANVTKRQKMSDDFNENQAKKFDILQKQQANFVRKLQEIYGFQNNDNDESILNDANLEKLLDHSRELNEKLFHDQGVEPQVESTTNNEPTTVITPSNHVASSATLNSVPGTSNAAPRVILTDADSPTNTGQQNSENTQSQLKSNKRRIKVGEYIILLTQNETPAPPEMNKNSSNAVKTETDTKRNKPRWICNLCDRRFVYFYGVKTHLQSKHEIYKPYKKYRSGCSTCGKMSRHELRYCDHDIDDSS